VHIKIWINEERGGGIVDVCLCEPSVCFPPKMGNEVTVPHNIVHQNDLPIWLMHASGLGEYVQLRCLMNSSERCNHSTYASACGRGRPKCSGSRKTTRICAARRPRSMCQSVGVNVKPSSAAHLLVVSQRCTCLLRPSSRERNLTSQHLQDCDLSGVLVVLHVQRS